MRVFITGGSGYVGQAVVEALVAEGHDLEALVRERAAASVTARHARDELGWVPREAGVLEYLADSALPTT